MAEVLVSGAGEMNELLRATCENRKAMSLDQLRASFARATVEYEREVATARAACTQGSELACLERIVACTDPAVFMRFFAPQHDVPVEWSYEVCHVLRDLAYRQGSFNHVKQMLTDMESTTAEYWRETVESEHELSELTKQCSAKRRLEEAEEVDQAVEELVAAKRHEVSPVAWMTSVESPCVCRVFTEDSELAKLPRTYGSEPVVLNVVRPARSRLGYPQFMAVVIERGCLLPEEERRIKRGAIVHIAFWMLNKSAKREPMDEMVRKSSQRYYVRPLDLFNRILSLTRYDEQRYTRMYKETGCVATPFVPGALNLTVFGPCEES